ncbi:hypothetical protein M1466_00275 [Candidatus Dependentiae bacterium]|nr:hypothetical protein [Candidatus Dependentiae bacterium]
MNIRYLFLLCAIPSAYASNVIVGNAPTSATTFANPIQKTVLLVDDSEKHAVGFFAGAAATGAGSWALSYYNPAIASKFVPLATANANINGAPQYSSSPLYNVGIAHLAGYLKAGDVSSFIPIVVPQNSVQLSAVTKLPLQEQEITTILQSAPVNDASGNVATAIQAIAATEAGSVFAAVQGNGSFGDRTATSKSGIAYAVVQPNAFVVNDVINNVVNGNRAALFDTSLGAISVDLANPTSPTNFATMLSSAVCMHWDKTLHRLYIGISAQADAGAPAGTVGVRSVVVGYFNASGQLTFVPIAPNSALNNQNNQLIGSLTNGAGNAVATATALTIMHTSSGLDYLIVVGGDDTIAATGNLVYALPLIDNSTILSAAGAGMTQEQLAAFAATQGTIAANNSAITFYERTKSFTTVATTPGQMATINDTAALVGGALAPVVASNGITQLFTVGDTVYIAIASPYALSGGTTQQPGLFAAQAILNNDGRIVAWTPWRRVAGNDPQLLTAALDSIHGVFLLGTSSTNGTTVDTIATTVWSFAAGDGLLGGVQGNSTVGFIAAITKAFQAVGGVQSLYDYTPTQTGFTGSMAIGTGYRSIIAAITGYQYPGVLGSLVPMKGDFTTGALSSTNDTFPVVAAPDPATTTNKFFTITGPVLQSLNAITCQTIATTIFPDQYLIVGGTGGVAILTADDGSGYTTYPYGLQFRRLGNFTNVVQLVADEQFIFVATTAALYRVVIDAAAFAAGTPSITKIADVASLPLMDQQGAITDVIVTPPFALLATTKGLYRTMNNIDVSNDACIGGWLPVPVPEGIGVASKFVWISSTGQMAALANGGTVTVFESYIGQYAARLNRFYIALANGGTTVTDTVIQPFNDRFEPNRNAYFVDYGQFKNMYASDGSIYLSSSPVTLATQNLLSLLPPYTKSGELLPSVNSIGLLIPLRPGAVVSTLSRSVASGAWLVAGTFGLLVNE